jgi:hypothetical protein
MWPTSDGNRTLQGAEASLMAQAIDGMIDQLMDYILFEDEIQQDVYAAACQTGIAVFDSLTINQRIAVLHHAAVQLLTDRPFPHECLSAIDDATIAAIYAEVRDQIEIEIDFYQSDLLEIDVDTDSDDTADGDRERGDWEPSRANVKWRRLVHAACLETLGGEDGDWMDFSTDSQLASVELSDWEVWVDCLASAILWDRDFEFAETFLDADPEMARRRRVTLGISDDYFVMPAPDPSSKQITQLIDSTRDLVRSIYLGDRKDDAPPDVAPPYDVNDPPF